MQEQKDLVMCARILTSMLSLIKKEETGTAVSISPAAESPLLAFCGRKLGDRGRGGGGEEAERRGGLKGHVSKSCRVRGSTLGQR